MRRLLLTALPKVALSRATGLLTRVPLPLFLRSRAFGLFSRRYGVALEEIAGEPRDYRSLQEFFQRPLKDGARAVSKAPLVWPCDGKVVTTGPVQDGRIVQVKGIDYAVAELLGSDELAARLGSGSQATIYLAPGDYHRVHAPFAARLTRVRALRGTLFPVNPGAVQSIPRLFPRNARHVFECRLADERTAVVVMVGAINVGGTQVTCAVPGNWQAGAEIGRFGFGSTVVVLVAPGGAQFGVVEPETVVRMGSAAPVAQA